MKQQNQTEDLTGPMKMIFNYNNIFFSFFYDDTSGCIHRSREFAMNYVYSGEMLLDNGKEQIHVGKGECVFIQSACQHPETGLRSHQIAQNG